MPRRKVWLFLLPCLSNTMRATRQARSSPSLSEHRSLEIRSGSIGTTRSGK